MPAEAVDPLLVQARTFTRKREYPRAMALYRQILEVNPDSIDAHEGLAMASFVAGELVTAEQHFEQLIRLQPMEARHFINLGAVLNRQRRHKDAAEALRKAIQRNRRSADAYYNLGIAQRHLKQTSMAVSAYKEAIRLDPQMAEGHQNLGNVYLEMGSHQLAIGSFQRALEIRPDFDKARVGLHRAEDALEQAKASRNPFGRLVQSEAQRTTAAPNAVRELSEAERHEDRQQVWALAQELRSMGDSCAAFLRDRLEPQTRQLQRVVAENKNSSELLQAAEDFQRVYDDWTALRRQLRRKALELRSHEEFMNTPDGMPE